MDSAPVLGLTALRLGLSLLALAAAAHKLSDPRRARTAAAGLIGRQGPPAQAAWITAAALELLGASATVSGALAGRGPVVLAAVWLGYAAVLARSERAEDCGCGFGQRSPDHQFGLARNLVLVGLAVFASAIPVASQDWVTWVTAAPAALVCFLLYLAVDELGSHPRLPRIRS